MAPKVLVIEDDPQTGSVIASTFSRLGYDVRTADEARIGLALHQVEPADLVIADVFMLDGEGVDTLLKLAEDAHPPKIIALSGGQPGFDVLPLARAAGAHATVLKPVSMSKLVRIAEELLDGTARAAA